MYWMSDWENIYLKGFQDVSEAHIAGDEMNANLPVDPEGFHQTKTSADLPQSRQIRKHRSRDWPWNAN